MAEKRLKLAGKKRHNKIIDMEWVYAQLDNGRTVKSVAEELQVSESTLRRRHKEYQALNNDDDNIMEPFVDWDLFS